MQLPETTIIGLGRLGTTLFQALRCHNIPVKSIFNRSEQKARVVAEDTYIRHTSSFPDSSEQLGDLIFITVSDGAIAQVAEKIADLEPNLEGKTFVHCSGNESAKLLQPLREKGGKIASFHPLQTFTKQSDADSFKGIYFSVQGDQTVFPILKDLANKIGAYVFQVNEMQKSHLHAAAVMASNYLTTLLDASVKVGMLDELSDEQVKKALLPLVRTTLKNTENRSFQGALTGPVKRGDIVTIKKHLSLLEDQPELRELYCILGLHTVNLVKSLDDVDGTTIEKMRKILSEPA
jgi:predicted short-subunit dehydrogenase-like oxidoreductase (DUF2520 family)